MKAENKQNSTPNKQPTLFSNPYINSKMNQQNPKQQQQQPKCKLAHHNKTDEQKHPTQLVCRQHMKQFSNLFCADCLSYSLCRTCISATHFSHEVMQFGSQDQLVNQTKQILLQNLEETLKDLKSKENQVKNRSHQANLIRNSLRTLEQEVIGIISGLFKDIEGKLLMSIEKTEQNFNIEIQTFFKDFNQINDELRENLMKILDGNINTFEFSKQMIRREAPEGPNFMSYKSSIQKYKKIFKDVKSELTKVKTTLQKSCNSILSENLNQQTKNNRQTKLDKYIQSYNYKGDKVNQSFMKTLRLLQMPNEKQNILKGNMNVNVNVNIGSGGNKVSGGKKII